MTHPLLSLLFPQTLMLVSSTTRPLLGCVWNFPSTIGLAYATTSLVIHEMIPIILMAITNLTSLYTLYTHGRNPQKDAPVLKRVPAEKRAAKVRKKGALEVDEGVSELCKLIFKCNKLLLKNVNALPQRKGHQLEKGQLHIHTVIKRIQCAGLFQVQILSYLPVTYECHCSPASCFNRSSNHLQSLLSHHSLFQFAVFA